LASDPIFSFLFRGTPKEYSEIHKDNFQPRIGLAYALNEKSVIRLGAGRYITRTGVSDSILLGGNPPLQPTASVTFGSVDDPGGISMNRFPLAINTQDRIFKNPESWSWSAIFQRELGFGTTIEVGYIGRRGLHAPRERNLNQLQPGALFEPGATLPNGRTINPDFLRPFKGFGIIRNSGNEANSLYNSFQVDINRRFTRGLLFGIAYTLSKSSDDGSAYREVIPNAFDASALWGPSAFDRRHMLVVNAIYELPFLRSRSGITGRLLGGWVLSVISQFRTGTPFSIATADDFAGVGPGSGSQLWIVNGDPSLDRGERGFSTGSADQNFWFKTKNADGSPLFTPPPTGTFSNQRVRNLIYGPGSQFHNMAAFKDFLITENHRIQFRVEAFNWPNHPNFGNPDSNPRSANFGKVTSKSSERQLQFALRYQF
jgi:hypothetical protein